MNRDETIRQCYQVPGQTWPTELGWLYDNISKSRCHAEIGTYCGRSLLASCGGMAADAFVLSVDDRSEWTNPNWVEAVQQATISLMAQSVRTVNAHSINALRSTQDSGIILDSVFIDGCHEYAECKADILGWITQVKPGGLICGHDYWPAHIGVMDAVNEVFNGRHSVVSGTRLWFYRL